MRHRRLTQFAVFAALCALVAMGLFALPSAGAVSATTPTTTLSAIYTSATPVTYTFSGFTLAGNQLCSQCNITFPPGTDLTNITIGGPAGTITTSGTVATILFSPQIPKGSAVTIVLNGIKNPPIAGANLTASLVFYTALNKRGPFLAEPALNSGPYNVVAPHLDLTLGTSSVTFELTPEVASPSQDVTLTVDSSHDYLLTREMTGQWSQIGLGVTGSAAGTHTAGVATYTDSYSATAGWTVAGDTTYTAGVTYTVIQQ